MSTFAFIPLVPDFMEIVIIPAGFWLWGYTKGRKRRRLTP